MSWEWVVLILGLVTIIATLMGYIAWTQMKARMFEAYPKTLPDMLKSTHKEET